MPYSINLRVTLGAALVLTTLGLSAQPAAYLDPTLSIEARVADLLPRLTVDEKIGLVHARSTFADQGVPRLGIPDLWMDDGPMGVREEVGEGFRNLNRQDDFATAMPATLGLAATFNPELAREYGAVIGQEARQRNKNIMLGPSLNIQRTPLCGRNFEYMGEDPWLTSRTVPGGFVLRQAFCGEQPGISAGFDQCGDGRADVAGDLPAGLSRERAGGGGAEHHGRLQPVSRPALL